MLALTNTLAALIPGIGFGVLSGVIRGGAREIFKGIRYVFGFGTSFALILLLLMFGTFGTGALFFVPGLFSWGGIADRIGYGIRAKREYRPVKTALVLPVFEQVVHVFTAMVFAVTSISFLGLTAGKNTFQNLGHIIAFSRSTASFNILQILLPAVVLILLLVAVFFLHAGLCAKERYLKQEEQ